MNKLVTPSFQEVKIIKLLQNNNSAISHVFVCWRWGRVLRDATLGICTHKNIPTSF